MTLASLVAGGDHTRPRMKSVAVLADGCTKVQTEPKPSGLPEKLPVSGGELLGLGVNLGRIPRQKGRQQGVWVYFLSGYSRSMQLRVRIPSRRRYASDFPAL